MKLPRKILSQLDQVAVGVSHVGSALTPRSCGRSGDGRSTGSDKFRERSIAVGHLESKLEGRGRERRRIKHHAKGLLHGIPGIEREAGGAGFDLGILVGSVLELEAEGLRVEGERLVEIRDDKHDIVQDFELQPCLSCRCLVYPPTWPWIVG